MTTEACAPPTKVSTADISAFDEKVTAFLYTRLQEAKIIAFPENLRIYLRQRTMPRQAENIKSMDRVFALWALEFLDVATRISDYQYISTYSYMVSLDDKNMNLALIRHCETLSRSEIYVIMERGAEAIRFLNAIINSLGASVSDPSKSYTKKMKKEFDYDLSDRHSITHAKSRPTLSRRLLTLMFYKDNKEMMDQISDSLGSVFAAIDKIKQAGAQLPIKSDPLGDQSKFREEALARADAKADKMWQILTSNIEKMMNPATNEADK